MSTKIEKKYYSNGAIKEIRSYKNNLRHQKWTYYYKNGNVHYEKKYKNGKLDGARISYFENGEISFKGGFKNNKRIGEWNYYDIDTSPCVPFYL